MTGIQIPSALIPHQTPDPQLSRPALAIDKLAALMPVPAVSQGDVQSSTGETVQARQPGAILPGSDDARAAGLNGSTRETLSFAARAILDLFEGGDAQPLRGNAPLLPSAPTAGAGTTALSNALATLVDQSGMFYESHVAQWVMGQRPLAALLQEPQATLRMPAPATPQAPGTPASTPTGNPAAQQSAGAPVALLPYGGPAAQASTPPPSAALLAELTRPVMYPVTTGVPAHAATPTQPAHPHGAAAGAQQAGQPPGAHGNGAHTSAAEQRRAAHANAAAHAYQVTAEVSHEGHYVAQAQRNAIIASWNAPDTTTPQMQPDVGQAVHPASEGVVRQQLELLATQQFRATLEAWPGMPFEWEVSRDGHADAPEATTQWSTRVRLELPRLGNIDAVLTLGPQGLDVRMVAADADSAAQLMQGRAGFREQLDARGIALLNVAVQTRSDRELDDRERIAQGAPA